MSAVLAVLGVLASIAGIIQTVVVIVERAERKRRSPGTPESARRSSGTLYSSPSHRTRTTADAEPPWDPEVIGVAWRSALAYLLGFVGGLIWRRNRRRDVRFHATQSILIDVVALIYLPISLVGIVIYVAVRYPGAAAKIPATDVVMWTWVLTSMVVPPALHVLLAVLALMGRRPRVPLLWRIAATVTASVARNQTGPDARDRELSVAVARSSQGELPEDSPLDGDFDDVWERVKQHAGEEFHLRRGLPFHYKLRGDEIFPSRTSIGIHRSNFVRAWERRPLSGPGQLSKDVIGPSYVYAILSDPRVAELPRMTNRRMATELVDERPFDPDLHLGPLARAGRCSWHGCTCDSPVVASVRTRDKGGETWHAVCQRALTSLRGE